VEDSSSLGVKLAVGVLSSRFEHVDGLLETNVDEVTLTLVLAIIKSSEITLFKLGLVDFLLNWIGLSVESSIIFASSKEWFHSGELFELAAGDVVGLLGVRVDRHLDGWKSIGGGKLGLIVVRFYNFLGLSNEHVIPEFFDASGTVQKDNNFNVAFLGLLLIYIMTAIALALASLKFSVSTTDFFDFVSTPSLGRCTSNYK